MLCFALARLERPCRAGDNRRVAGPAAESGTACVPWSGTPLAEILCGQEDRVVATDNTVRDQGRHLQMPPAPHTGSIM